MWLSAEGMVAGVGWRRDGGVRPLEADGGGATDSPPRRRPWRVCAPPWRERPCLLCSHPLAPSVVLRPGALQKLMYDVNVTGTRNVIAACVAHAIPRLVYTSTASVVFAGRDLAGVDEAAPVPPPGAFLDYYTSTKAEAEAAVRAANGVGGVSTVCLRPSGTCFFFFGLFCLGGGGWGEGGGCGDGGVAWVGGGGSWWKHGGC